MTKQRPDPDKLANELVGASAFFRRTSEPVQAEPEDAAAVKSADLSPDTQASRNVTASRRHDVTTSQSYPPAHGFDINRPTASRDSLRLAVDETKALDALRADLKWDYDLTVSKNDICRAALHQLLEDYAAKGEKSSAVARLKRKQTSR